MTPEIIELEPKLLVGISSRTTLSRFVAPQLWQQFMPVRSSLPHIKNANNYSIQLHDDAFDFHAFTPHTEYTYWAAAEVSKKSNTPLDTPFSYLEVPGGLYAVFLHKGSMDTLFHTLKAFYTEWLPHSGFHVDKRPHFELLDERYLGHTHPDSQEEIWVPITRK